MKNVFFYKLIYSIQEKVEETILQYIIRDHNRGHFEARKEMMLKLTEELNNQYEREVVEIENQYYNMKEKVEPVIHIVAIAEEAMKQLNIKPLIKAIRSGTDGSQLSYMGLPCSNIGWTFLKIKEATFSDSPFFYMLNYLFSIFKFIRVI